MTVCGVQRGRREDWSPIWNKAGSPSSAAVSKLSASHCARASEATVGGIDMILTEGISWAAQFSIMRNENLLSYS